MLHDKPNRKILEELDELVYGHEDAKKSLITLVNRSKLRHFQKWGELLPDEALIKPSKCLLIGGSGTGKTHLVQSLAKSAHFPLLVVDGSSFNPTGATGGINPETLKKMIMKKAGEYYESRHGTYFSIDGIVDQMVVFVDEFDKLSSKYDGSSGGSWNEHTQTHFLTMFENYDDLSGVSWIFAGAFTGIDKKAATKKNGIGFHAKAEAEIEQLGVTDEDVVKYGMLPEIVGRLTSICKLDKLTEEDYYNILIEKVIPNKMLELAYFRITAHDLEEERLQAIAKGATESSQGVRYLYREIEKHFLDIEFSYEDPKAIK